MHTQNKEGNYLENNISDPNLTDLFMQLWWPSSRECSPSPCLMQLFKRFTENSALELYWCSYFCDANGEHEAVSGKAQPSQPFDYRSICCGNEHLQIRTITWLTRFKYNIRSLSVSWGCCAPKPCLNCRAFTDSTTLAHSWWEPDNAPDTTTEVNRCVVSACSQIPGGLPPLRIKHHVRLISFPNADETLLLERLVLTYWMQVNKQKPSCRSEGLSRRLER